ncbi:dTDP-4-dehydrorhamnose reductase [Thermoleptolyngbya sp. M55_K2018_002]|uniref:dTDP-4-dehydrorhamnose reductase n=1 Tax=Thermoleptolyngbya sp. M55_K2018_002 TaxID=2747808 RepID=UPI0019EEEB87|nr:dTDP-4-dehydrorhamnose reductase [Thermoleptolyngbya sp. M55_K2018_002]HIK39724.1 dTDP-4-dehydrorhamnose reductase [Thermoleptolyngbya sp. M55_K2018_002]
MSRILITGATGQVGQELVRSLAPIGDVIACDRTRLNLAAPDTLKQTICELRPDVIVNAAAYTAVDKAEQEPELANTINGMAPKILAECCKETGASLIHISTDYVFDGTKNTPYLETDAPNPVGAYAKSKHLGEVGIQDVLGDRPNQFMILRTAWVYGVYGTGNFVKTMLRVGSSREELRVVMDQIGSPTWAADLAGAIAGFTVRALNASTTAPTAPIGGIYHVTNTGVISWYDFAVAIFEEAEALGYPLTVQRVVPITTDEYPLPAPRPAYSVLSGKKTAALLGDSLPYWRQSLRRMLADLQAAVPAHP